MSEKSSDSAEDGHEADAGAQHRLCVARGGPGRGHPAPRGRQGRVRVCLEPPRMNQQAAKNNAAKSSPHASTYFPLSHSARGGIDAVIKPIRGYCGYPA